MSASVETDRHRSQAVLATRYEITPKIGYALTIAAALLWLVPFLWMVVAALRPLNSSAAGMASRRWPFWRR